MAKDEIEIIFIEDKKFKVRLKEVRNSIDLTTNFGVKFTDDEDESLEGHWIDDYELNDKKLPKWIMIKKVKYKYSNPSKTPSPEPPKSGTTIERKPAVAPYNFVPLNATVIASNATDANNNFSRYEGNSGYIEVEIENLTPFYIRGNGDNFFMIGNKTSISGSSLRGLIRMMVEMMSYSKMSIFDKEKRLFMRFIAAFDSDFKDNYYKRMGIARNKEEKNNIKYKAKAGFLNFDKTKKKYFITPSSDKYFTADNYRPFSYFHERDGIKVYSGKMQGKHKHYKILNPNTQDKVYLPQKVESDYRNDTNRNIEFDLLSMAKSKRDNQGRSFEFGVPVFYTLDINNEVDSIGHTKYYRLPNTKDIGDLSHIYETHYEEKIDFADSIFGNVADEIQKSGKVFFESLELSNSAKELASKRPKILNSPKPTSFQLYLSQPKNVNKVNLKHWDSQNSPINGYKQYWHRITPNDSSKNGWVEIQKEQKKYDVNPDPIKPLEKGAKFSGRIRFDNLTDEELGALLCALNLPDNCCHKLGMAKPLGLGSIRINAKVSAIKRADRYQQLFSENNMLFEAKEEASDGVGYLESFKKYIISNANDGGTDDFWQLERMKQLKTMLTFDNSKQTNDWLEKTRYMLIEKFDENGKKIPKSNEFTDRSVLPKPDEV